MDERDEQEIETRLRAAFQARSEFVTHQKLRPGVPPNAHTAGAKQTKRRGWAFSWRAALVPLSVTAALAGGIFVGTKLPDHSNGVHAGADATTNGLVTPVPGASAPGTTASVPNSPSAVPDISAASQDVTFAGLAFQPADWQLTKIDASSACLQPKGHDPMDRTATLPCGVDSLWIQTAAAADAWPVSTAKDKEGWWPKDGTSAGGGNVTSTPTSPGSPATTAVVPCPAAKPSPKNSVKTSATLRTDDKYPLSGTTTADYREWTVTCTDGTGVLPRLWQIKGPTTIAVMAVSVDARYDGPLLDIVASMHPVSGS